jgi:hypothetical protein
MINQVRTQTPSSLPSKSSLLSKVLRADGVFAALSGASMLIGATTVAKLIDLETPAFLTVVGLLLLAYAGLLLYYASKESFNRRIGWLAIELNLLWVVGSYVGLLLGLFPVNTAGKWAIAIIAEAVLVFAVLEFVALRRRS